MTGLLLRLDDAGAARPALPVGVMRERAVTTLRPRAELLRRRSLRKGCACVALGALISFVALIEARIGYSLRRSDAGGHVPLIPAGVGVFIVRFGLFVAGTR